MDGREREARTKSETPKTTIGSTKIVDLSLAEKQDIVLFSGAPGYAAILKLIDLMLVEARDEAVLIPAHERDKRLAALDIASTFAICKLRLQEKVTYLVEEQLGEFKRKAAEEALKDQSNLEDIILSPINSGH